MRVCIKLRDINVYKHLVIYAHVHTTVCMLSMDIKICISYIMCAEVHKPFLQTLYIIYIFIHNLYNLQFNIQVRCTNMNYETTLTKGKLSSMQISDNSIKITSCRVHRI